MELGAPVKRIEREPEDYLARTFAEENLGATV